MPVRLPDKHRRALRKMPDDVYAEMTVGFRRARIVVSVLCVLAMLLTCGYILKSFADGRLSSISATGASNRQDKLQEQEDVIYSSGDKVDGSSSSTGSGGGTSMRQQDSVVDADNILLVGMDSRAGANGEIGAGSAEDVTGIRTDSIMFLHVPTGSGSPSVVSFPRDLSVRQQDCAEWDGSDYSAATVGEVDDVKINSLYEVGGPRCLVRTVQEITGMKINRFVSVDFAGFQSIVDAVGGVDITTDGPINDDELGLIVDSEGTHHLDGTAALNFVRARKVEGQSKSDYERIERQQQFGMAVLSQITSSGTLTSPSKLNALADAVHNAVSGENIDSSFILSMIRRASSFSSDGVSPATIPTTGSNDNGNEVMDEGATEMMMRQIATGQGGTG